MTKIEYFRTHPCVSTAVAVIRNSNLERSCGIIYSVTCVPAQTRYIGMSLYASQVVRKHIDIPRLSSHYESLKQNRHPCKLLQLDWNTYGIENFLFEILELTQAPLSLQNWEKEKVRRKYLLEREAFWHTQFTKTYSKPQNSFACLGGLGADR